MPTEPSAPASLTAAASCGVEVPAMGAWMRGCCRPRRAIQSGREGVIANPCDPKKPKRAQAATGTGRAHRLATTIAVPASSTALPMANSGW